jgi:hypothetical protein
MKALLNLSVFLSVIIFFCCKSKPLDLQSELRTNFLAHLKKADSSLILDSFYLWKTDSFTQKVGAIIDDSIYSREFSRIKYLLEKSLKEQNPDSAAVYKYESDYMTSEIDSLTKNIDKADTTKKLGLIVRCRYRIKRGDKAINSYVVYFFNRDMKVMNSEMIDSMLQFSYRRIK